tara:strand:+ start:63421 stop:64149 length:729 start_codon:yes stop_codon:yes gene_type:complete
LKIIKLDTINSTNSFLKEMSQNGACDNFTVVVAKHQTDGKGQIDKKWITESGKNLTFSLLFSDNLLIINQKYINLAVSLAIYETLKKIKVPNLSIKWPNDIMTDTQKIAGILIETFIRGQYIHKAIIGIGLNVNQETFPNELNRATSLKLVTNKEFDLDAVLVDLLSALKEKLAVVTQKNFSKLEAAYGKALYMKNVTTDFRDNHGKVFTGKITGISKTGNLLIEDSDQQTLEFGIKEIKFA